MSIHLPDELRFICISVTSVPSVARQRHFRVNPAVVLPQTNRSVNYTLECRATFSGQNERPVVRSENRGLSVPLQAGAVQKSAVPKFFLQWVPTAGSIGLSGGGASPSRPAPAGSARPLKFRGCWWPPCWPPCPMRSLWRRRPDLWGPHSRCRCHPADR